MPSPPKSLTAFPAVARLDARILILGSMPGVQSLAARQYYAHPRNAFWPIMQTVVGFPADTTYENRLAYLLDAGIALWDVIAHCERPGSLDSDIRHESVIANNFSRFLQQHANIHTLLFNGQSVATLFKRHVLPQQALPVGLRMVTLPSTSPANARITLDQKRQQWAIHFHEWKE